MILSLLTRAVTDFLTTCAPWPPTTWPCSTPPNNRQLSVIRSPATRPSTAASKTATTRSATNATTSPSANTRPSRTLPAPTGFSTAGSGLTPGGGPPVAGGQPALTSKLLDEAAWSITKLASGRPGNHSALDNLTAELYERAEKFRSVETMARPLGDVLTDAAAEFQEAAAEGLLGRLPYRVKLVNDLRFAARWVDRAVPHPLDLSGGASKRPAISAPSATHDADPCPGRGHCCAPPDNPDTR